MFVDLCRPFLTEFFEKLLLVERILLYVYPYPLLATVFVGLLLSVLVKSGYTLPFLIKGIFHFSFVRPFPFEVDGTIGYEYMGVVISIFLFTPVMYGIGGTISLFCEVVSDVVLDDFFLLWQV